MNHRVSNQVILIGHLGDDPEFFGKDDTRRARFDLATNDSFVVGEDRRTRTDWHTILCWRGLAKSVEHLAKGDQIALSGALRSRRVEVDGRNRRFVEVHATDIEFLKVKSFTASEN